MHTKTDDLDEMPTEVDFRGGVRGKYQGAFRRTTNVALLDADVASRFPTDLSVNEALRSLIEAPSVKPDQPSEEARAE